MKIKNFFISAILASLTGFFVMVLLSYGGMLEKGGAIDNTLQYLVFNGPYQSRTIRYSAGFLSRAVKNI